MAPVFRLIGVYTPSQSSLQAAINRVRGRSDPGSRAAFCGRRLERAAGVAGQVAALMSPEPGLSAGLSFFTSLRHSPDTPGAGGMTTGGGWLNDRAEGVLPHGVAVRHLIGTG